MRLPPSQGDGGVLAEARGEAMPIMPQQFFINIRFQAHMPAIVTVVLFLETRLPVNIGMALGIQAVMPQKPCNICLCNPQFFCLYEMFPVP